MATVIRPEISTKNELYISKHRYYELKHFCLQYDEWKKASRDIIFIRSGTIDGVVQSGRISDTTGVNAAKLAYFHDRIEMVESASKFAAGDMWELMLRAVTKGLAYDYILPPCCKEVWYTVYRRFFRILDSMRE